MNRIEQRNPLGGLTIHAQLRVRTPHRVRAGRWPLACAVCAVLLHLGVARASQAAVGQTAPADDLPPEMRILFVPEPDREYRWTLIGTNDKAREQEALHPELNVLQALWHVPVAENRSVFKFEFTRPVRTGDNVLHLYVKADGDEDTGRQHTGSHKGVDYTFTLINGDPHHEKTRLDAYEPDGRGRRGAFSVEIRENVLYLGAEMVLLQQDGRSVFEYFVSSYVGGGGPRTTLGYQQAISESPPPISDPRLLINPGMDVVGESIPGWRVTRRRAEEVVTIDRDEGAVVIDGLYAGATISQTASLEQGHYLLRALAKANVFQIHLFADNMRIHVGMWDEYRWVELPFTIDRTDQDTARSVPLGFRYQARPSSGPASRLPARLHVKRVDLVRLGDTVVPEKWLENLPADPLHRLKLLEDAPLWARPGKVVFEDAFLGTELWLMTQEGQMDHSYVGHPDFSHEGKYLHIGLRRRPRGLLRTDGSARHLNDEWGGIVWLFPWMQRRLPPGADPVDWIVTSRSTEDVQLLDVATGQTHRIELAAREGWRIVHYPGIGTYGGRGPRIAAITHETLVWVSTDDKFIGLSDIEGGKFRAFEVKSLSAKPEDDVLYPVMSGVGGKSGHNWRDAVDHDENRYHLFELNRDNFPDHPTNPYQVWGLCLTEGDRRGLQRVVFHPNATITEFVSSQTGSRKQPSANWWEFAAGFPWSGDNAILMLEDRTLIHMSSLGMHSSFHGGRNRTVSINCADSGDVTFMGTFAPLDRITWPHEFRRDRDFAVVEGWVEPAAPVVVLDLEHKTIWAAALTFFHDYTMRYRTRTNRDAYHKHFFRSATTFSPDFTKVVYFSSMLTGEHPDRKWGDVYVAVTRYPQPPVNVSVQRSLLARRPASLTWERPRYQTEIEGFNLYRSEESGRGYAKVNRELLTGTRYELPPDAAGFYVLTSVEYSGLESREFSNEANVGRPPLFRHFYQAESGRLHAPMVPFFEPAEASGAYAVAVTDPELMYREQLRTGLAGSVTLAVAIPETGPIRVLARVRGMSALERATYMTGRPFREDPASGNFALRLAGQEIGRIPVSGSHWQWVATEAFPVRRSRRPVELEFTTSAAGIALDHVVVTNDPEFVPRGRGQTPEELTAVPVGLRVEKFGPDDRRAAFELMTTRAPRVKLAWEPVSAPQGVSHYNVYRADSAAFEAEPESLLGSPGLPVFHDGGLEPGQTVYYRVQAVDAWGNRSPASTALAVIVDAPSLEAAFRVIGEQTAGEPLTFDAADSRTDMGAIEHWQWNFGDGTTAEGARATHAFDEPGTYSVTLSIANARDEWAMAVQSLAVRPGWLRTVLEQGAVWIEAESHTGEGGGTSRQVAGRVNASGMAVTNWERDLGHWLEWDVTVPKPGRYALILKYASRSAQAVRACRIDGKYPDEQWQRQVFPGTGGYSAEADNWAWRVLQDAEGRALPVELTAAAHTVRMTNHGGGMALDAFLLVPFDALPPSM